MLPVDPFGRYGEIRGIPITFGATGIPAGSDASREKPCDRVRNARKSGHASRPHLITTPWCAINTPTSLATPIPNVKAVDTLARYGHPPARNFKGLALNASAPVAGHHASLQVGESRNDTLVENRH